MSPWAIAAMVGAALSVLARLRPGAAPSPSPASAGKPWPLAQAPKLALAPASIPHIPGWPGYYLLTPAMVLTPSGCVHVAVPPPEMAVHGLAPVYPGGWMSGGKPEPKPPVGTVWAAPLTAQCFAAGAGLRPGVAHMVAQLTGAVGAVAAGAGQLRGEVAAAIAANAPALAPLLALGDQFLAATPVGSVAGYVEALQASADRAGIPTATVVEWVEDPERAIRAAAALAAAKAGL